MIDLPVIGLVGAKGSGKDTVATMIQREDERYARGAFGDKLKEMALALDPYIDIKQRHTDSRQLLSWTVRNFGWERAKTIPEVRRLLQRLGTEVGRQKISDSLWVDLFNDDRDPDLPLVITDARFTNEIDYVRALRGVVWRIERPEVEDGDPHPSEREWRETMPDLVIENTGTINDLSEMVRVALAMLSRNLTPARHPDRIVGSCPVIKSPPGKGGTWIDHWELPA